MKSQRIFTMLDTPIYHSNTEVKQHWAWILLGWEILQGIPGSAGTYPPPPCGQSIVYSDSLCLNQVIETRWNKQKKQWKIWWRHFWQLHKCNFNSPFLMEHHVFENVNNCWNTDISFYLETSGGQNSNPYLKVVHFFNDSVN